METYDEKYKYGLAASAINTFLWGSTPQGHGYWNTIYETLDRMAQSNPKEKLHEEIAVLRSKIVELEKKL